VQLSDADLVALIATGDQAAFSAFHVRYEPAARRLARRVTGDAGLAEDVVQEAFLAVWRQSARFDATRAQPATWLMMIVHHRAVDAVRREIHRGTIPVGWVDAVLEEPRDDAWARLVAHRLADALALLPEPQREVLELTFFAGLSQSQAAGRLGQPLGTIKSRTHTALTRLRATLGDLEPARDPLAA
jgi:RNA polymerase sigma-70 factor (ECF subfamily)